MILSRRKLLGALALGLGLGGSQLSLGETTPKRHLNIGDKVILHAKSGPITGTIVHRTKNDKYWVRNVSLRENENRFVSCGLTITDCNEEDLELVCIS